MNEEQFALLIEIDSKVTHLVEIRLDHELRLRKLERFRNWVAGVGAAISAAAAYLFAPHNH
jgi:hypothetical protein